MPLIQVDLDQELFTRSHTELSSALHQAQIDALDIPVGDLFQIFTPHAAGELKFDPAYNGVDRRSLMVIRITMVHMYGPGTKQALFRAVLHRLGECGVRSDDILISVVENGFEDWCAGRV